MALARQVMGAGFSAGQALAIGGGVGTGISAAGTTISDATDLGQAVNEVTTVASGAGVQLPSAAPGDEVWVYNSGANELKVYPHASTAGFNDLTVGTAYILATNTGAVHKMISATKWMVILSA
jgi:hypothetical protein